MLSCQLNLANYFGEIVKETKQNLDHTYDKIT